jgi:hypothetical protein
MFPPTIDSVDYSVPGWVLITGRNLSKAAVTFQTDAGVINANIENETGQGKIEVNTDDQIVVSIADQLTLLSTTVETPDGVDVYDKKVKPKTADKKDKKDKKPKEESPQNEQQDAAPDDGAPVDEVQPEEPPVQNDQSEEQPIDEQPEVTPTEEPQVVEAPVETPTDEPPAEVSTVEEAPAVETPEGP